MTNVIQFPYRKPDDFRLLMSEVPIQFQSFVQNLVLSAMNGTTERELPNLMEAFKFGVQTYDKMVENRTKLDVLVNGLGSFGQHD